MNRLTLPENAFDDPQTLQAILSVADRGRLLSLQGFGAPLESHYLQYRARQVLPLQRLAAVLAFAIFLSFLVIDRLGLLHSQAPWVRQPILWISLPACVLYFVCTFQSRWQRFSFQMAIASCIVHSTAIAYMSAESVMHQLVFMPEAPVIQQLWCVLLLGLPLPQAIFTATAALLSFVAIYAHMGIDAGFITQRAFMIVSGALVGLLATGLHEHEQRLGWVRALQLRLMAERDALTGLYNHRVFYERGQQMLRQCQRERRQVAALLIDIDHFKQYNDDFGHLAGDQCLRQVAGAIGRTARRPMDIAARTGGEEFTLLLFDIQPEAARERAEQLRQQVRQQVADQGRGVTISIGLAISDIDSRENIEALANRADEQLYAAKRAGRDRVSG